MSWFRTSKEEKTAERPTNIIKLDERYITLLNQLQKLINIVENNSPVANVFSNKPSPAVHITNINQTIDDIVLLQKDIQIIESFRIIKTQLSNILNTCYKNIKTPKINNDRVLCNDILKNLENIRNFCIDNLFKLYTIKLNELNELRKFIEHYRNSTRTYGGGKRKTNKKKRVNNKKSKRNSQRKRKSKRVNRKM